MKKLFLNKWQYSQEDTYAGVFFNKIDGLIRKRLQHRCFPMNIAKFSKIPIFMNTYFGGVSNLKVDYCKKQP